MFIFFMAFFACTLQAGILGDIGRAVGGAVRFGGQALATGLRHTANAAMYGHGYGGFNRMGGYPPMMHRGMYPPMGGGMYPPMGGGMYPPMGGGMYPPMGGGYHGAPNPLMGGGFGGAPGYPPQGQQRGVFG